MAVIFATLRAASGAVIFGDMGAPVQVGNGRITSGALVWNNNSPHRAAPFNTIVRTPDGLITILTKTGLVSAQDATGDWVVTFQDPALIIGSWYRLDHTRTDIGTLGAIGTEFVRATA